MSTHPGDTPLSYAVPSRKTRVSRRGSRATAGDPPALRDLPIFSTVDDATLARLALEAKVEAFEDGAVIFRQGDPVSAVVVILHGFVKMLRIAPSGDETLIGIRSDGETVGEPPSNANEIYRVSAEAVGQTSVLKLPAARFARLMKESPALSSAVTQDAKDKIAALITEIESLKAQNADQRLANFILSLCPPGEERCRFRLPYDKRLIAARLGVKQETLSRAFAKLRDYGVRTETRDVLVESVSRLVDQCDQLGRQSRLPSERAGHAARDDAA
ncbi:Crp/Fnr family transcriptional regulator [Methylocystis sp. ATCC 49242]|uniref:Crp/Fnr family transcriptional regulator n=1 Tax=Methylocystis sp. ATCC 49242 TaxID=622637 RepID=UPI0001F867A3|nr:Crp/Fnr family transcriptional regulator [Methylocystis sp. ATCC 49242]